MDKRDIEKKENVKDEKMSFSYAQNFYPSTLDTKHMFIAKKAHKIMTALYMITELLPEEEPIRDSVRKNSLQFVSQVFDCLSASLGDRAEGISKSQNLLEQTICALETMQHVGYISEMNMRILILECHKLQDKLSDYFKQTIASQGHVIPNANRKDFAFSDDFFGSDDMSIIQKTDPEKLLKNIVSDGDTNGREGRVNLAPTNNIKTIQEKKSQNKNLKDISKRTLSKGHPQATTTSDKGHLVSKKDIRQNQIIDILKKKGKTSIAIIRDECPGYTSKTIQRDLNELIIKGIVVREGDRRWAVYSLFIG